MTGSPVDGIWATILDSLESVVSTRDLRALVVNSRFLPPSGNLLPMLLSSALIPSWRARGQLRRLCELALECSDGRSRLAISPLRPPIVNHDAPHRTLDQFVVGPGNASAHLRVLEVAANFCATADGGVLLLCGPDGAGKSHLLLGLASHARAQERASRVVHLTSAEFTSHLLYSVQHAQLDTFREYLLGAQMLVIDSIENFQGRTGSQVELQSAIHRLSAAGVPVVMSSNEPVAQLQRLEPEFRALLTTARSATLLRPERDQRIAILRERMALWCVDSSAGAAASVASKLRGDLRQIDAELTLLLSSPTSIDPIAVRALALPPRARRLDHAPLPPRAVLAAVARHFGMRPADLRGSSRSPRVTLPRQIAMYLLRDYAALSYPEIGQQLRRHHTTAIHACRRIRERSASNSALRMTLGSLGKELQQLASSRPAPRG